MVKGRHLYLRQQSGRNFKLSSLLHQSDVKNARMCPSFPPHVCSMWGSHISDPRHQEEAFSFYFILSSSFAFFFSYYPFSLFPVAPSICSIGHPWNALSHFSFLILSLSQGRYLYEHRLNTDKHPRLEWISNPRSQRPSGRRQFMP
jgi:hypothetical protein